MPLLQPAAAAVCVCAPPGDDEAKRRGVQKSILERAAPPTFDVAVEMLERNKWQVYADVAVSVDALLAGESRVVCGFCVTLLL